MADYIDAGKLNKAAQVLELRETAPGVWEWVCLLYTSPSPRDTR